MGPRCFKCLMFSPSGPVELVFLVDLRAAEVCAIVIFMGVVCSDSIFHDFEVITSTATFVKCGIELGTL